MSRRPLTRRPTKDEILAAEGGSVRDLIAPDLSVLFCGINPSLYSAAVGHHFARPGNRFWKTLHAAGWTPRLLSPEEERGLLDLRIGITNLVARATASADALSPDELVRGARRLAGKIRRYTPRCIAVLGIGAYRTAFGRPGAAIGAQPETIGGARVWVLPNPSGLNASYQLPDLVRAFRALALATATKGDTRLANRRPRADLTDGSSLPNMKGKRPRAGSRRPGGKTT